MLSPRKKKKVGGRGLDTSNQHGSSLALTISWVEERDQSERKRRETHRRHLGPDLEPSPLELKVGFMAYHVWFRDFGRVI